MPTSFEEMLEHDGQICYTNRGTSMMPLLRENRDLLVIDRKTDKRLRMLDIPLFKRANGQYVMHRVMWVSKDGYTLCGDNQWYLEKGVKDSQILGVLTAVVRGGRRWDIYGFPMRCYSVLQWLLYPFRAAFLFFRMSIWPRIKRRLLRK